MVLRYSSTEEVHMLCKTSQLFLATRVFGAQRRVSRRSAEDFGVDFRQVRRRLATTQVRQTFEVAIKYELETYNDTLGKFARSPRVT